MFSNRYSAIFIHIPKVAGTSVKSCLRKHGFSRADINQEVPRDRTMLSEYYLTGASVRLKRGFDVDNFSKTWKSCFKFAFVRNPWDRMVSSWSWIQQRTGLSYEFKRFIYDYPFQKLYWDWHTSPQYRHIEDESGNRLVDYVGRYETLEEDLNEVCKLIGITSDIKLPHAHKTKHKPYIDYYDDDMKLMVGEMFFDDIDRFGYEFGDA